MPHSPLWIGPFVLLLLSIAILPLAAPHFWERNKNKGIVAFAIALPVALLLILKNPHGLTHTATEYFSFMSILIGLFFVSGGIALDGDLRATPLVNTSFLALGSVLASLIGTTGASMLLIRPLLKTNRERKHVKHIPIFFIFLVSNAGGLLTPIGDPPLFLGYLRGVPFFWTVVNLWPIWLVTIGILLLLFFIVDSVAYEKEALRDLARDRSAVQPLKVRGLFNFLFLGIVVAAVFLPTPIRELVMIGAAVVSYKVTPRTIHEKNNFSFGPVVEVAVLFAGIFVAMVPALHLLETRGADFGISRPFQFFWLAGALSSFLDNAPTYLSFLSLAQGLHLPNPDVVGVTAPILKAISAGAVLMGANTYIGNGPNFMVKAISDHMGIKTPSFFGYMLYSVGILIPLFAAITFLFFRT